MKCDCWGIKYYYTFKCFVSNGEISVLIFQATNDKNVFRQTFWTNEKLLRLLWGGDIKKLNYDIENSIFIISHTHSKTTEIICKK